MISVRRLTKSYRVHERRPGFLSALGSIFHRTYKVVRAVNDIAFDIGEGERVGFLGPNGAGKTTTLKILAGLLYPTSGDVRVLGFAPWKRETEFLRSITFVTGQKQQLLWDLPAQDTFDLNRAIYDVSRTEYRRTLDELVALLDIGRLIKQPVRQLSLGERMKCELAAALVHRPRILFLDEPTIGLDVSMQAVVRDLICEYNTRHKATVILTSHYMDDVLAITPRVLVIDHGTITYGGSLTDLVRRTRPEKQVTLRFGAPVDRASLDLLGGRVITHEDNRAVLLVHNGTMNQVVSGAIQKFTVVDLTVEDAPLEEVLRDLFREGARDAT